MPQMMQRTAAVDSDAPPVSPKPIVAEQAPGKPKQWNLSVRRA